MAKEKIQTSWQRRLAWLYVIGGGVGLTASLLLSIEVFDRLKNPEFTPVCNLNPVLSCTSVADSAQSHIFGFPNYFMGIAAYGAFTVLGLAILAGGQFHRWFWRLIQIGMTLALAFVSWLQFESLYRIGALCLFCMVVWAVTGPLFWYTTLFNFQNGHLPTPRRLHGAVAFAQHYRLEILVIWFLLIVGLILKRFWYYWSSLI